MPVPSVISDLSQTAASNYPAGSDSPATLDDTQRAHASFIAQLRDGKGFTNPVSQASAATTDIGGQNALAVEITGTTTITSFGTTYNGPRFLRFTGALTLTHNAATLNLPGAANITTAAGDTCIAYPNQGATGWHIVNYQRGDGVPFTGVSQLAGLRNKIINGAMMIDQRNVGVAQTFTAGDALAYSVDRWYGYCTGANVTGQRVAGTAPNKFNYQYTGAAAVTKIGHAQRIEAVNCQDLAGKTATLSVDLANSLLTTVTWTAWYATTEDSFGTLAAPTRTQIATGTFTVSATLARYSAQIAIPAAATTGIEIELSVAAQTSGTWTIGRGQLEVGSVATPFENRPMGMELALCHRYFWQIPGNGDYVGTGAYRASTTQAEITRQMPVPMRAAPSIVAPAAGVNVYNTGGAPLSTASSITGSTTTSFWVVYTTTAVATHGTGAMAYTATGATQVTVSAEL